MVMDYLKILSMFILGYLLGSLNSSLLVGKVYGVDVRKHGSGNAGATNTLRTLGKKAAVFVILGDALKGVLACLIGSLLVGNNGLMVAGIGSIVGHNWPLYFKFKGGKGVLTSFAVALMMDWKVALILFAIFAIVVAISKYISLGSIIGAALFPVAAYIHKSDDKLYLVIAVIFAFLIILRHRSNIKRIVQGTESKFGKKKTA
ncbi:glycerol-3-phosphate 1-O-acyltransferase PlsY [Pseudobacteroides cellulosolvens]|uniref:Glycerol-3-phosphate acyltransferase n=1 Tax=Pseudobacteroides cellulosolvens ATCC 35603 = DSM 2933 TaxID=398512 RepID=A0A0L6JJJ3_9FIRM|nr:glycerol-3-phosphate 1-O-acyltransferase PlsY [Pseudobacteroides cellulosolvens]KNY26051.1 Glycerol-3-phosphate acyltransferase [Pseudobacteroides cellulosolvens ATCC 35603 = DSM 2933]